MSTPDLLARAETIYRDKQIAPDDPAARTFRDRFSRPVSIHMIGVWDVEQRWFTGAHANVGGGYGEDPLADLPLAWIQKKALAAGLDLTPCTPPDQALTTAPRDSFAEFMGGTYQWFARRFKPGNGRHIRKYDTDPDGHPKP